MSRSGPRPRPIEIVGHRGAAAYHPGNSRAAFETAIALGVDRIECDVQPAADGTLVLIHDAEITTVDGRRRRVRELTIAELRRSLPGLVTLDELAALAAGRALLLDLKRPGYEAALIAAIERHGWAETAVVSSTDVRSLRRLRAASPTLRLGLSTGHWATSAPTRCGRRLVRVAFRRFLPRLLPAVLAIAGASEAMLQHHVVTPTLVARLHARGRRANAWTVNEPDDLDRVVAAGVDSVTSDRPDLARRIVAAANRSPG